MLYRMFSINRIGICFNKADAATAYLRRSSRVLHDFSHLKHPFLVIHVFFLRLCVFFLSFQVFCPEILGVSFLNFRVLFSAFGRFFAECRMFFPDPQVLYSNFWCFFLGSRSVFSELSGTFLGFRSVFSELYWSFNRLSRFS